MSERDRAEKTNHNKKRNKSLAERKGEIENKAKGPGAQ